MNKSTQLYPTHMAKCVRIITKQIYQSWAWTALDASGIDASGKIRLAWCIQERRWEFAPQHRGVVRCKTKLQTKAVNTNFKQICLMKKLAQVSHAYVLCDKAMLCCVFWQLVFFWIGATVFGIGAKYVTFCDLYNHSPKYKVQHGVSAEIYFI